MGSDETNSAAVTAPPSPAPRPASSGFALIEHWRLSWRFWSVRLNAVGSLMMGAFLAWPDFALGVWNMMPIQIGDRLPARLAFLLPLTLFVAAIAARLVKQNKLVAAARRAELKGGCDAAE